MTEERPIGGTCVNRGCLPSKNLIEAAKLIHDARTPRYPGLTPCQIKLDFNALISQKDEVVHGYRKKKYESLVGGQFRIETGHVQFVDANTVEINGKQLTGEKVLIATGSRPVIPDIEGLGSVPFITSDLLAVDEGMELRELPKSLLILGGGYIALELGQMFNRFGTEVTIIDRNSQLLARGYEPEAGQSIGEIFAEEGIQIVTRATIRSVRREQGEIVATAIVGNRERQYRAEKILLATGRRPNTDKIAIERSGVELGARREVRASPLPANLWNDSISLNPLESTIVTSRLIRRMRSIASSPLTTGIVSPGGPPVCRCGGRRRQQREQRPLRRQFCGFSRARHRLKTHSYAVNGHQPLRLRPGALRAHP